MTLLKIMFQRVQMYSSLPLYYDLLPLFEHVQGKQMGFKQQDKNKQQFIFDLNILIFFFEERKK